MQSLPAARTAGVAGLGVSLAAGMTSNALLFLGAFQFRLDWFREPRRVLAGGATSAEFRRWPPLALRWQEVAVWRADLPGLSRLSLALAARALVGVGGNRTGAVSCEM